MKKLIRPIAVILAMSCQTAGADVVAWYHFDEAPVGTRTTGESAIVDSIHPTATPGYARTFQYNRNGYWNKPTADGTEPTGLMPVYTNGIPDVVSIFDPATSSCRQSTTALQLLSSNPGGISSADGSIVYLNDSVSFYEGSFTIEALVQIQPTVGTYLYLLRKCVTSSTWAGQTRIDLLINKGCPVLEIGGDGGVATASSAAVNDGKWHRIEMVVDRTKMTATLYVDGGSAKSVAFTDDLLDWTGAEPMTLGASPNTYMAPLEFRIADLRISNAALEPTQFLKTIVRPKGSPLAGANTLFYVNFEDSFEEIDLSAEVAGLGKCVPALLNRAPYRADFIAECLELQWGKAERNAKTQSLVADVRYPSLRVGETAECVTNAASLWLGKNAEDETAATPALSISADSTKIYEDSFTIEYFIRHGTGPYSRISGWQFLLDGGNPLLVYSADGSHIQVTAASKDVCMFSSSGELTTETKTSKSYRDDKWHHFAFVYDKTAATFDFYIDYRLVGRAEDPDFGAHAPDSRYPKMVFLGYSLIQQATSGHASYSAADAKIDEIRITRGALSTDEFLRDPKKGMMLILR